MTQTALTREMALRIGLASRAMPGVDATRLLRALDAAVGLPPTPKRLRRLTALDLQAAASGELKDVDPASLQRAVDCLKDPVDLPEAGPAPQPEAYAEGDMPGSIRLACASNTAESLDGHFGSCARFLIYQVSSEGLRLIEVREAPAATGSTDDKNMQRARLIADCQVLYVVSVGGPAAAKVVKVGVHPIKYPAGGSAREHAARLQGVLAEGAPPWLARIAAGQGAAGQGAAAQGVSDEEAAA
jgi:nitrogen fixation protein NifX